MKPWMRKSLVVLFTIMTLGLYTPPAYLTTDAQEKEETSSDTREDVVQTVVVADAEEDVAPQQDEAYFVGALTEQAKQQTVTKLGPRIINQVEDEFTDVILPKMEEAMETIFADAGEDSLPYYGITEQPAQGHGERIFNIYDFHSEQVIAKFHVRRDNRPMEGYWFNFHYHLHDDGFEKHYVIGEIYWDKNIPPKWMA